MSKVSIVLLLIFCLVFSSFSAGAIKAKGSSSSDDEETDDIEEIEDQGGDIDTSSSILEKLKDGNGGVDVIKSLDDISTDLSTRGDWTIAVDEVDLEDAPEAIKQMVHAEVNMLKDGQSTYLAGAEALLAWVINEAANNIGRGDQPFTTAVQENDMNTPAAVVATSGEVDFQAFEWEPPSDRDELGTISALGKEEKLSTVALFPPLVKMTGESDE